MTLISSGCGGASHAGATQPVAPIGAPPPNVVSNHQIAAYPANSAAHTLLALWQAIEFSDADGARHLVTPSALARLSSTSFAEMVSTIGDNIPGIQILNTDRLGTDASVRAYLVFYAPSRKVSASAPMAFQFRRTGTGYELSDLSFFLRRAREIRIAQRGAPHQ